LSAKSPPIAWDATHKHANVLPTRNLWHPQANRQHSMLRISLYAILVEGGHFLTPYPERVCPEPTTLATAPACATRSHSSRKRIPVVVAYCDTSKHQTIVAMCYNTPSFYLQEFPNLIQSVILAFPTLLIVLQSSRPSQQQASELDGP
jgi:hypothetical protein